MIQYALRAGVAELVDAPDSKSGGGDIVWVQVPSPVSIRRLKRLFISSLVFFVILVSVGPLFL